MLKWLDDSDILMYSTHTKGRSIDVERFTKYLKDKIYKKMAATNDKSYLGYLSKLVNE